MPLILSQLNICVSYYPHYAKFNLASGMFLCHISILHDSCGQNILTGKLNYELHIGTSSFCDSHRSSFRSRFPIS